ncbi:hypothetical protein Egran_03287, partial [Elaphomyces granulatus]
MLVRLEGQEHACPSVTKTAAPLLDASVSVGISNSESCTSCAACPSASTITLSASACSSVTKTAAPLLDASVSVGILNRESCTPCPSASASPITITTCPGASMTSWGETTSSGCPKCDCNNCSGDGGCCDHSVVTETKTITQVEFNATTVIDTITAPGSTVTLTQHGTTLITTLPGSTFTVVKSETVTD